MHVNRVEPNAAQKKLWADTRVSLVYTAPAFAHIFYSMMDKAGSEYIAVFTDSVPIAATNGKCLMLNPETFFKYSLGERVFIVAHEIMHCILNHCAVAFHLSITGHVRYSDGKQLDYIHALGNIAQDFVINDILVEAKVGQFSKDWLHDKSKGKGEESWLDVYRRLYEQYAPKKGKGKGQGQEGQDGSQEDDGSGSPAAGGKQRFDKHFKPGTGEGKNAHSAASERNEAEWRTAVAAAAATAKAQGRLPASLERVFSEILNPQVDWKEKIQGIFHRRVGSGGYNWRRPDRRMIVRDMYAPGRSGFGAGDVVVAADTSGSIGEKELDMFMAEISGILTDVRPKRLFLLWCDAKVHRVDELTDPDDLNVIRCKGAPGGGGTDFRPVFSEIDKLSIEPDALVYLTDGMGTFPHVAPSYPVIWGNIYPMSKYPWGDVVDVPRQA
jgi:predicted metal-dependent peptidase